MKKQILYVSAFLLTAALAAGSSAVEINAENPICQTAFSPDPAPMVDGDTLYVYTGVDRDGNNDFYYMTGYQCFSTTDMKNWTNHGVFMNDTDFKWASKDNAWASQCIERNGKYYFYFTTTTNGRAIGVGVSDSPTGPFKDVLGKPLVGPNWDYIDPTVMIDDDGQAWLMFGNPKCYYVKLKEDMITLDGEVKSFDMTTQAFGPSSGTRTSSYGEGPWISKHNNLYYLVYAAFYGSDGGESMGYSTAPTITGPWTYGGQITKQSNCFTTHGGVIDYKDHSYFFYHKNGLKGGGTFNRSAAVEEFTYGSDGSIPLLTLTNDGPDQLEYLNPYKRVEAETICWSEGIKIEQCSEGGADIANIEAGDYVKVSGVDFGEGAETFKASVASAGSGGKIELHLDSKTGPIVGTATVSETGGWQNWEEVSGTVKGAEGVHDLYLVFNGGSSYLFNVDWWKFESSKASAGSTGTQDSNEGYIFHSTFENSADSWTGRGSASTSVASGGAYSGSKSLLVSGREATWNGAQKTLSSSKFKAGQEYAFSVCFSAADADDPVEYKLTLQYDDASGETKYDKIAQTTGNPGEYVQLYNKNYKIPSGASNLYIIAETTEDKCDFHIDEAIAAPGGTEIEGPKSSAVSPTDIKGDLDFDGRVSVADLVALKDGVLNGFKSKSVRTNADVDRSTEANAADALYLQKYLLGVISEFPDNTPPEPEKPAFNYNANLAFKEAPGNYLNGCSQSGKIVKETYNGINGSNTLNVYLPYGYDSKKQYNIFYLMHGGGENENTIFSNDVKLGQILDNMIMNGEIEPMIVVTPTFNKCTAQTFYKEWRASVVPFVEGKYSTYAKSTSEADLKASRYHRAYGGFSMGSCSTWANMINNLDLCAYWMPLSGDNWEASDAYGKSKTVADAIDKFGLKSNEYFIMCATGSEDIAYPNMNPQIAEMKKDSHFIYSSDLSKGNFYYLVANGKTHWWGYVRHYVYDMLPYFFHEGR